MAGHPYAPQQSQFFNLHHPIRHDRRETLPLSDVRNVTVQDPTDHPAGDAKRPGTSRLRFGRDSVCGALAGTAGGAGNDVEKEEEEDVETALGWMFDVQTFCCGVKQWGICAEWGFRCR